MKKLLLAALLGGLAMFLWEFVAHMFTPLGDAGLRYLPKPDVVSASLQSAIGDTPGMFMFPTGGMTGTSSREEQHKAMERMMEEIKTKPSGLLVYKPAGREFNFGKNLGVQFATDFLKALIAAWLLARTGLLTFGSRVGFVVVAGLLAAITTSIPYWNWYGFTGAFTTGSIITDVIGFFFAGLAIAAVLKRSAGVVTSR
jgi:hypothetical protein